MKKISLLFLVLIVAYSLCAQEFNTISGTVKDKKTGEPIESVAVSIEGTKVGMFTDKKGNFLFCDMKKGQYKMEFRYIGYEDMSIPIDLIKDYNADFYMIPSSVSLNEVEIQGNMNNNARAISKITINQTSMFDKVTPNFSKLLANVPGVSTIDIGAGISKPVIRGLGFNRIAVINRGITQQNQQWGADHGLEINQFDFESATIHKGAASLMFGSDAMAGAVEIEPEGFAKIPYSRWNEYDWNEPYFKGEAIIWGATNNDMLGGAFKGSVQKKNYFLKTIYSYQDYADYRVPADEFNYLSYNFPIRNRQLKNTAGKEQNISLSLGYAFNRNLQTSFNVGNNYQKSGFFSGAHGIPDISKLEPDGSTRNIDMPYSRANHFTITNNTQWQNGMVRLVVNSGYQDNHRQEYSPFHSHYGSQSPAEGIDPNLELDFRLKTYSSNASLFIDENKQWRKTIGAAFEYQHNRVGGYNFFLPEFDQITGGLYLINKYYYQPNLYFTGGLRYDVGKIDITGFYDPELAKYLERQGHSSSLVEENAWRAYDTDRHFGSFSGSLGFNYTNDGWNNLSVFANIGKSFRFPTAAELGSNGVHHGAFRHEIGNPNLDAEQGYSLDVGFEINKAKTYSVQLSLFSNYFSNFIYLQPSLEWSLLPDAGQRYNYTQAEALLLGGEYKLTWYAIPEIALSTEGEYVRNENLDTKYPLPFTPPFKMKNEIIYSKSRGEKKISYYNFSISHQWFSDQNRIANGEEKTPGANLFNITAGLDYRISPKSTIRLNIQAQNIFDTRYLNHLSFYRKLNIPEPGRNIQIFIRVPFNS